MIHRTALALIVLVIFGVSGALSAQQPSNAPQATPGADRASDLVSFMTIKVDSEDQPVAIIYEITAGDILVISLLIFLIGLVLLFPLVAFAIYLLRRLRLRTLNAGGRDDKR